MKTAISLLTCNKPEIVQQSIKPLLAGAIEGRYHLFVCDGSTSEANEKAIWDLSWPTATMHANIKGGAGAAIVYALTMMLQHKENYDVVGLCESDVLLHPGWTDCLDLFDRGRSDGLVVGATSARCFVDRVLFQRDGFAVMHNLGAGQIMLTRRAAQIVLDTFRTGWTTDNRRIFSQISGVDVASFWAFRANEHALTADWHWDAALAAHGLASLALTPSPVEMIGQPMTLAEQGLEIVATPGESRKDQRGFNTYAMTQQLIRDESWSTGVETRFQFDVATGTWTHFPHQMAMIGGKYEGDWYLKEVRAFGTFGWVAGPNSTALEDCPSLTVPIFGSCAVLVSGGKNGGTVEVVDEVSGFIAKPELPPEGEQVQVLQLMVPGGITYRNIKITARTPGCVFYGIQTREKQPHLPDVHFDHSALPHHENV